MTKEAGGQVRYIQKRNQPRMSDMTRIVSDQWVRGVKMWTSLDNNDAT